MKLKNITKMIVVSIYICTTALFLGAKPFGISEQAKETIRQSVKEYKKARSVDAKKEKPIQFRIYCQLQDKNGNWYYTDKITDADGEICQQCVREKEIMNRLLNMVYKSADKFVDPDLRKGNALYAMFEEHPEYAKYTKEYEPSPIISNMGEQIRGLAYVVNRRDKDLHVHLGWGKEDDPDSKNDPYNFKKFHPIKNPAGPKINVTPKALAFADLMFNEIDRKILDKDYETANFLITILQEMYKVLFQHEDMHCDQAKHKKRIDPMFDERLLATGLPTAENLESALTEIFWEYEAFNMHFDIFSANKAGWEKFIQYFLNYVAENEKQFAPTGKYHLLSPDVPYKPFHKYYLEDMVKYCKEKSIFPPSAFTYYWASYKPMEIVFELNQINNNGTRDSEKVAKLLKQWESFMGTDYQKYKYDSSKNEYTLDIASVIEKEREILKNGESKEQKELRMLNTQARAIRGSYDYLPPVQKRLVEELKNYEKRNGISGI